MTAIERTAYPRFKQILSAKDFAEIYTPTPGERLVAHRSTKGRVAEVGFLVLLKTYQRLGCFVPLSEVPSSIIEHIAKPFEPQLHVSDLAAYDTSGTRQRHILLEKRGQLMSVWRRWRRSLTAKRAKSCSRVKNIWLTWAITTNSFSGPTTKIIGATLPSSFGDAALLQ
ncbi:DUF4158 domain-containing protein [Ktedonobacter racemifer]|uniref:DUF4158 domain-containing protein n=1 Tax=Ktedonobacter racemifer TaxID=363277 RepID=UPI000697B4BA|nr:DUF4158 domain-containing protein [Ktedonobacter racemifer]